MPQNKIDFNQIDEIKNKADIVSIIGKYIKLSRRGANYFGVCPFHADHNPSLVVSPSKKIWKCFVCGSKGNVFTFIQKYKKISFLEAVKEVATIEGYDLNKLNFLKNSNSFLNHENKRLVEANAYTNDLYKSFLMDGVNKEYLDYLTNHRHLSLDTIKYFEFGYAPAEEDLIYKILTNKDNFLGSSRDANITWNEKELCDAGIIYLNEEQKPVDFLINRITIPIYDNNNYIVGFSGRTTKNTSPKYLNTGSTKIFSKGNLLFNFNKVRELNDKRIIIVEGFMDAIALHNCNHKNVVATMGVALTDKHLTLLNSLELDTVILCFDNDAAGELATIENGKKLMNNGFNVYVVAGYDKQTKDVDELMQTKGKEAIDSIINNRIDFISFLINLKLANKNSLDDIQTNVNFLLKEMNEYGDVLLRTKHFDLISKLSGIHQNDLQIKFNEFSKNNYQSDNKYIKNYNNPKKSDNFNFDQEESKLVEKKKQTDAYSVSKYSLNLTTGLLLGRFANIVCKITSFLIVHNDYINKAFNNDLIFGNALGPSLEVKLLNVVYYLYEKDGKVTKDSYVNYIKNNQDQFDKQLVNIILSDEEFDSNGTQKRNDELYKKLLSTLHDIKKQITQFKEIKELLLCKYSERDSKLKELIELNKLAKK